MEGGEDEDPNTLAQGKSIKHYVPIKLKMSKRTTNVISVVNSIPLRGICDADSSVSSFSCGFPFSVRSLDFKNDPKTYTDPFDGKNPVGEELKVKSSHPNTDLLGKRESDRNLFNGLSFRMRESCHLTS